MLTRGCRGSIRLATDKSPDEFNSAAGLTYEQVEAMEYGALLGFEDALADPDYVRHVRLELGRPVGPIPDPMASPPGREALPRSPTPPRLQRPADIGRFLPEFAAFIEGRQRASWG